MNLPTPKTRIGWMLSLFLISLSFIVYYGKVFEVLSTEYNISFWQSSTYKDGDVDFEVKVPKYISRFTTREILISAENTSKIKQSGFKLIVYAGTVQEDGCVSLNEDARKEIFFCPSVEGNLVGCTEGTNILDFDEIPYKGKVVKTLWVVGGKKGDTNGETDLDTEITFGLLKMPKSLEIPEPSCLELNGTASASFNSWGTLSQSFLRTLLLPPWSNGLIPALVLFVVYATEYKIQPKKKSSKNKPEKPQNRNLGTYFLYIKNWLTWMVAYHHFFAFFWVAFLYIGLTAVIVSFPLCVSSYTSHYMVDFWTWVIIGSLGLIIFLGSKILLGYCEPTDLKDNDPIYSIKTLPATPVKIEDRVRKTFEKIAASLDNRSFSREPVQALTTKLESGFLSLSNSVHEVLMGGIDASNQSQTLLAEIGQTLSSMHSLLEKQTRPEPAAKSLSLAEYRFNFQAILVDPEALRLFVDALNSISRSEFEKLKDNVDFSLRLLSLLANPKDGLDKVKIEGVALIGILADSNVFKDVTVLEKWLKEAPVQYIPALMDWMFAKKDALAEKYLKIVIQRCDALQSISLLAKYISRKEKLDNLAALHVSPNEYLYNVFDSLILLKDKEIIDVFPVDLTSDLEQVLYPFGDKSISSYGKDLGALPPTKELEEFHAMLLKILCALPADLFERVSNEIYVYYENEKELPKSKLSRFMQAYRDHKDSLSGLQADWRKGST